MYGACCRFPVRILAAYNAEPVHQRSREVFASKSTTRDLCLCQLSVSVEQQYYAIVSPRIAAGP